MLLDLATLGTIADVVPLTMENRVIVKEGLKLIQDSRRHGITALKKVAGIDNRELRSELLSFTLIPRINAAGRIANATDVVRLFLSDNSQEAADLGIWLDRLNSERQKIEEEVYQEALSRLNDEEQDLVIVLSGKKWHQGVLGIVASRLAEEFNKPAFILAEENDIAKGSARSIPSFDICKGLAQCRDILISFGGHKQAAGIRLRVESIPAFKAALQCIIKSTLSEDDLTPTLEIDADITLSQVNTGLVKELSMLGPFGYGNGEPLFGSKNLAVINPRIVGKNHLKMRLKQGTYSFDSIGFDMGTPAPPATIDAVFTPTVNEWEGGTSLQLNLKALRPSK
ncbi:MAG: hypothetical protein HY755_11385 [Nitrospirae bacterium]|nr:hypothetical protein [Nitrospirota bacterium]